MTTHLCLNKLVNLLQLAYNCNLTVHFYQIAYTGSQNENTPTGTSILSVSAQDIDQTGSVNAQVQYSLISGDIDYFNIDPQSGVISNQVVLVSLSIIMAWLQVIISARYAGP